ncbi:MAG: aldehyde-activating protein [Lysobacteraceae bacterium]|nr:MAG: aldehyde-activating protein [Xanthomonadaceae bacterium]
MLYQGGCHCGAVRFEVEIPDAPEVEDCNCSICRMTGYLHLIVPASRFRLLCGKQALTTYRFNTGVAQHTFCRFCGIKPFYVPRSNPDGIDVNLRCLDRMPDGVRIVPFDGRNWEQHAARLAHKSRDPGSASAWAQAASSCGS